MARWIGISAQGTAGTMSLAGAGGFLTVVICVLAVATVVSALCATHSRKQEKKQNKEWSRSMESPAYSFSSFKFAPSPRALINSISSKKLLLVKKGGRKDEDALKAYDRAVMEDGDFLWQRTILMGEKCTPPDFSGVIVYDDKGNRLPHFPPRSPKLNIFPASVQADAIQQR
eukprot:Gb_33507 [translate_table: standard]